MIIYVENGVGRRVAAAIDLFERNHGATAKFQHDVHPEMQRAQKGDEWWIEDIARRGWVILTQDRAILDDGPERRTVIEHKARVIAFARSSYTGWQKLRLLTTHWDRIDETMSLDGPQAITLRMDAAAAERWP